MRRYSLLVFIIIFVAAWSWLWLEERFFTEEKEYRIHDSIVTVRQIRRQEQYLEIWSQKMQISMVDLELDLRAGDVLQVSGRVRKVQSLANEGYARYLRSQGIDYVLEAEQIRRIRRAKGWNFHMETLRLQIKDRIEHVFREKAPFVKALVYGDRTDIDDEMKEIFSRAGVSHIIAISGFHIGMIAAMILAVTKRLPANCRYALAILGILFFVLLTGSRPSALRAAAFYVLWVGSVFWNREYDLISSVWMTASFFLANNPYLLYDRGFTLSFMAVLSIGLFYPLFHHFIQKSRFVNRHRQIARIFSALILTLSAQVLTLPLNLHYFGRLSLLSPLANLLSLPLISLLYPLIFGAIFCFELPVIGSGMQILAQVLIHLFMGVNIQVARLSFACWDIEPLSISKTLLLYLIIFVLYLMNLYHVLKENENHATGFENIC